MSNLYIPKSKILEATNNGLDVFIRMYPNEKVAEYAGKNKQIKVRPDEKTPSAVVQVGKNSGNWVIIDYGDDCKPRDCFQQYMYEHGVEYIDAINAIATMFSIGSDSGKTAGKKWSKRKAKKKEEHGTLVDIEYLEWTDELLNIMGEYGTEEAAEYLYCKPIKSYGYVKGKEVHIFESTEYYPIFFYEYPTFTKIYQPFSKDKADRFRYNGIKPSKIIFGKEQIEKAYKAKKARIEKEESEEIENNTGSNGEDLDERKTLAIAMSEKKDYKLENCIIVSGESDAFNVRSHSKFSHPIWFGSESMTLKWEDFEWLKVRFNNIYNLPDLDSTGRKQSLRTALQFVSIKNIELPEALLDKKDSRGKPCKDVKDYFRHYNKNHFDILIRNAISMRFWSEKPKSNAKGYVTHYTYDFSDTHGYAWLYANGFHRLPADHLKESYQFVRTQNNVVESLHHTRIRDYVNDYLKEKNLNVHNMVALRNSFYRSSRLNESSLSNLPLKNIDFKHASADYQFFFFENRAVEITAEEIKFHRREDVQKYVWEDEVKKHNITDPKKDYFKAYKNKDGKWRIDFSDEIKEHPYFQYLWCTSRIHWRKELEKKQTLTEEEKAEQEHHMVNKLFALGYYCHGYKEDSSSWAIITGDLVETELGTHSGGSGKSLFARSPRYLINQHFESGQNTKLFENNHAFDGVTRKTRGIIIDDAHRFFAFSKCLTMVTGEFILNPKGQTSWSIKEQVAPKLWITTNHSLRNLDDAANRRILWTGASDFFHHNGEAYNEARSPRSYFKRELFHSFTQKEWNQWYNLMFQCVKFFLSTADKIEPPMVNIRRRQLREMMGEKFLTWANEYFTQNEKYLNDYLPKKWLLEEYHKENKNRKDELSAPVFKRKLKDWCEYNGFEFDPNDKKGTNNRIQKRIDNVTQDCFYIRTMLNTQHPENNQESEIF